jgi:hypothetical protein
MCKVCADYQKGLLTYDEAWRNIGEVDPDHVKEVIELIEEIKKGD